MYFKCTGLVLFSLVVAASAGPRERQWKRQDEYDTNSNETSTIVKTVTVVPQPVETGGACEGEVVNGKNVNLMYWDAKPHYWTSLASSCLHSHEVITAYTVKTLGRPTTTGLRPVAASTITIDHLYTAPTPTKVAMTTVVKTERVPSFPYTMETYTISYMATYFANASSTSREEKIKVSPTGKPTATM